ncbi:MAG: cysteine--tRNA ligase [Clostridia bacterium]|nr:cysteine--tRNA ligase [Clostridia bacterium]
MRVYNSLTKTKETLEPLIPNKIKMYACGITVYDQCHIGHARQAITYDVISQYLRFKGYDVTYVRNYTDVDDKIIARANSLGINALKYSQAKILEAEEDLKKLRIKDADIKPKASENIENIIEFIKGLIKNGNAYATPSGDVYFSVSTFPDYGKLSGRKTDELIDGVRKEIENDKKDPKDFALWKSAKDGEIYWETPWGNGRPGWHIECSAMSLCNLGETIDIHGGGKDLIFPHHENEIAQSEALTGKPFAKYWIHNGLVTINGQKMSKSLGNSMTIKEALNLYNPEVIRLLMLSKHYSTEIDLNDREFAISEKQLYYFYNTLNNIDNFLNNQQFSDNKELLNENIKDNFISAMDDDFNTSLAISHLFSISKEINSIIANKSISDDTKSNQLFEIKNTLTYLYSILGILQEDPKNFILELQNKHLKNIGLTITDIENKLIQRKKAKEIKDYSTADEIRAFLNNNGIIINDSKEGTSWDLMDLYNID